MLLEERYYEGKYVFVKSHILWILTVTILLLGELD